MIAASSRLVLPRACLSTAAMVRSEESTSQRAVSNAQMRPVGGVRAPYWRVRHSKPPLHMLAEEFKNLGDVDRSGVRLHDYWATSDFIKQQYATPAERVNFVNPYERDFNRAEKRWHRLWHPPLYRPRRAWAIPPTPRHFDSLNFCKYITKTRLLHGEEGKRELDNLQHMSALKERLKESVYCLLHSAEPGNFDTVTEFLRAVVDDALISTVSFKPELMKLRVTHNPRCESFWVRSGFEKMYDQQEVFSDEITQSNERFIGDDVEKLGELAFTSRDHFAASIRREGPLRKIFDWSDTAALKAPVFPEEMDVGNEVVFNPELFNLHADEDILYQCPGYDVEVPETHKYGHLAIKNTSAIHDQIAQWEPETEEEALDYRNNMVYSTAVTSLFSWLNAQAHCAGYTQYNDVEEPFTSQLVLSNGGEFFFALGQLNTIAINMDVKGFNNPRTNLCCIDGPHKLYEITADDGSVRLNEEVVTRILQTVEA